jgi:hypothetical protein
MFLAPQMLKNALFYKENAIFLTENLVDTKKNSNFTT